MTKSQIFLIFCLSFILGVFIQSLFNLPRLLWLGILVLAIMAVSICWGRKNTMIAGFCLIIVAGGAWRFDQIAQISANDISQFNGQGKITFIGMIDQPPEIKSASQQIVVEARKSDEQNLSGLVLVTLGKYPAYEYGDKLQIFGQLKEPANFNGFDYQKYLAKDGVYSTLYQPQIKVIAKNQGSFLKAALFRIKNSFEQKLAANLPEPQFALADGLVLGEKNTLPLALTDAFNVVGLTHIIALSGFNITIIAESLRRLFNSLMISRHYSFWLAILFIFGFVLMTGASASVVRAAVMGCLILIAQKLGRLYTARNAVVFAGAMMIFVNPKILRFDLGFQLSFLATLGLIYISPLFEKYFQWLPENFGLRGIASSTLGAQIAVLPLILYSFGRLSLIAPLANLLILPLIPVTMLWIFLVGVAGWVWPFLAQILGWLAWLFLSYEIKMTEFLAKIPYAAVNVKIGIITLVILYILLFVFIFNKKTPREAPQ